MKALLRCLGVRQSFSAGESSPDAAPEETLKRKSVCGRQRRKAAIKRQYVRLKSYMREGLISEIRVLQIQSTTSSMSSKLSHKLNSLVTLSSKAYIHVPLNRRSYGRSHEETVAM